ncbi:MAG: ABC transporter ATP-binding protein [Actinomycetota bacterium]|nr:ABC transporter ATP-binding protein [Actinomycetota bacterium]
MALSAAETPEPAATRGWVRRLSAYMLRHRRDVYVASGAAVLGAACQTIVPLVEREIVDKVVVAHRSPLWPWLVALVVLGVAAFWFAHLRRYLGGRVALSVQYDLRNAMHDHLQEMDLDNLSRMPTGQLVARANSDSTLVQGLLSFLPTMSSNVLLLLASLGMMVYLSPLLASVSLVVAPALVVVSYRMRSRVFPATWDAQQREGDVAQIVDEDTNGVRVVKAFGQEQAEVERLAKAAKRLYGSQMRAVRLQARYQPLLQAVPALGQVGILALGGWLVMRHQVSLGTFLAFSTYIAQMLAPARQLAGVLTIAQQARAGVERIFQLLDMAPAVGDRPGAAPVGKLRGEICFSGTEFSYVEGQPALSGFDLHIAPGERVALVGPSGSGKSTALMMLSRFYDPTAGSVKVDGHDLREVSLQSLRREIGVVFEESFLFSDTVRNNIAYGRPDATQEEVEEVAKAAQAHGFIGQLPNGYGTVVGERGLTLSGGQRQRVALARALLRAPSVLVLDDATSAVDSKVEEAIHEALERVMVGKTVLLTAHRRSTLHLADRVVLVEGGRVTDQGAHEELMARNATYRSLLSGMEAQPAAQMGDRIEALASLASSHGAGPDGAGPDGAGPDDGTGITPSAWGRRAQPASGGTRSAGPVSLGFGLGGGGGGWRMNLAPTPELLAKVDRLPPVRDHPQLDLARESRQDRHFGLRRLLFEFRAPLAVGLALVVIDALASLVGPVLVKTGLDSGVEKGREVLLFAVAAVYLAVTLADLVDQVGETLVTGRVAQRVMLSLRVRIWAQLQRLSLDYYESEMVGRIMTRMTTDVDQFESLVQNGVLSALVSVVTFFGVAIALVVINTELGLATLSVALPLAVATYFFRKKAAFLYNQARERIGVVNADFQESLAGVRESQAFTHEELAKARFHRLGHGYLESRVAAQRLAATYFPFVQFLSNVGDAIVLGVGAGLVAGGHLGPGALIAYILYLDLLFSPIQQLSQVFDSWQQTRVSVGRVAQLMQLDTATPEAEQAVPVGHLAGHLSLESVHFRYPERGTGEGLAATPEHASRPEGPQIAPEPRHGAPEAIRGVSLGVRPGETVALVGETGAGKSTVMKMLARFYDPDDGAVRADGMDLRSLELTGYRRRLGYVPQEPFLFSGTIRDNIAYGRPDASDAEVEAAARSVGAHEFIASLPGGYNHELSEGGRTLSAGQRQLLCLARAELVGPAVLLLDEATSNLDLVTEARVATAMRRVSAGRTTVLIAHRLQTARSADRIVVLHGGQVAEVGSHEELLGAGGRYASMWEAFETASASRS